MRKSKLRILPDPASGATLITNGPYRFIRHPIYTAILLGAVGLLISHFSITRLIISILLLADLIIKLLFEEKMLMKTFEAYKSYMASTSRLIPLFF